MGSEWRKYRLEDLCDFINGFAFKSTDYVSPSNDTIEVLRMGYIKRGGGFKEDNSPVFVPVKYTRDLTRFVIKRGDIIIAMTDMKDRVAILGNTAWIRETDRFVLNQRVGCIRVKEPELLNPRFLYFYSNWQPYVQYLRSKANSGVQVNLSTSAITQSEILLPPLDEQVFIANILGSLDDKIELNLEMNETLEAMTRALFKSWFVDFDPVRAKAEGRDPGLPADIAVVFPDSFEDSELGDIPTGWSVGKFSDVAENSRRGLSPDEIPEETPYIALEHMPRKCIALAEWGIADGVESGKLAFNANDILFGKLRPYFHKVGVAPIDGVCSTDILVVAPRAPEWFGYVLGHASSDAFVEHTNAGSTGTKMPRTNWTDMARYPVILPPEVLARAYTAKIRPAISRIIASIHQTHTLAALRDALLPKLISGELRLSNAERIVREQF